MHWSKIKLLVAREIQYFELGIFSFNSYVYYLTRAFNLLTRAFNLLTCAFNLPIRSFNLATRAFSLLTREFELVTRGFELVTRVLLFHKLNNDGIKKSTKFTNTVKNKACIFSCKLMLCSPFSLHHRLIPFL